MPMVARRIRGGRDGLSRIGAPTVRTNHQQNGASPPMSSTRFRRHGPRRRVSARNGWSTGHSQGVWPHGVAGSRIRAQGSGYLGAVSVPDARRRWIFQSFEQHPGRRLLSGVMAAGIHARYPESIARALSTACSTPMPTVTQGLLFYYGYALRPVGGA